MAASNRTRRQSLSQRPPMPRKGPSFGAQASALPFVAHGCMWSVPSDGTRHGSASGEGAAYAASYLEFIRQHGAGPNLLGHIARDIDFQDASRAGYWIGFFSMLEQYVADLVRRAPPGHWAAADRFKAAIEEALEEDALQRRAVA